MVRGFSGVAHNWAHMIHQSLGQLYVRFWLFFQLAVPELAIANVFLCAVTDAVIHDCNYTAPIDLARQTEFLCLLHKSSGEV